MRYPLWLLVKRRSGLRGRLPYVSNVLPGGDAPVPAPPAGFQDIGFPNAPVTEAGPRVVGDAASKKWVQRVVEVVNSVRLGKMNCTLSVTLTPDSDITTITDVRISAKSALIPSPITSSAATEMASGNFYISSQTDGSAVLAQTNSSQADRSFIFVILG